MLRANISCRLYRAEINQLNWRHLLLIRNRCKILLRDHSVSEVYLKTCPKHYTVSAISETHATALGPNRPHNQVLPILTLEGDPPSWPGKRYLSQSTRWGAMFRKEGVPPSGLDGVPLISQTGYPCNGGQSENITFRHPSDAGGNDTTDAKDLKEIKNSGADVELVWGGESNITLSSHF